MAGKKQKLTEAQEFRSGRGTLETVFMLNSIVGKRLRKKREKLCTAFVDFKAALDKVDRKMLWEKC